MFLEVLSIILNIVILGALFVGARFAMGYLPVYFGERGKYLAPQGELVKIAEKVEAVKTRIRSDLKHLETQIAPAPPSDPATFEKEYALLMELWETLLALQRAALAVQPTAEACNPSDPGTTEPLVGLEKFAWTRPSKLIS